MQKIQTIQNLTSASGPAALAALEGGAQLELLPHAGVAAMDYDSPGAFFSAWFDNISQEVTYEPNWTTEDGHFDHALRDPVLQLMLPPGQLLRCLDEHNRKAIFIGTPWGAAVVFQRYSDDPQSLVCQLPKKVEKYGMRFYGYLSLEELQTLLGDDHTPNIGNQ